MSSLARDADAGRWRRQYQGLQYITFSGNFHLEQFVTFSYSAEDWLCHVSSRAGWVREDRKRGLSWNRNFGDAGLKGDVKHGGAGCWQRQ